MQELDGADEMVARLQAATSQSASTFSWEGARSILFRVLHLMAERKEGKATSKSSNVTSVLLLLFDFVQVVAVLASPEFGYTFDIFAWVSSLSIGRALGIQLIGVGWAMTLWGMSTLVLVLALSNAILVAWQVASGGHTGSLLPLRTLRAFVTLALTALYIPLVQSTARFLACDRIVAEAAAVGQDFPRCWGPTHAVLFGISVLVLVLFIPFALVVRGIFFDDTPTGGSVVSKPIARTEMLDTACRTTVVLAGMFLTPSNRLLVLLIVAILYMVRSLSPARRLVAQRVQGYALPRRLAHADPAFAHRALPAVLPERHDHAPGRPSLPVWLACRGRLLARGYPPRRHAYVRPEHARYRAARGNAGHAAGWCRARVPALDQDATRRRRRRGACHPLGPCRCRGRAGRAAFYGVTCRGP